MTNADQPSPPPSTFAVFRRRNFTLLWIAQLISTIGNALTSLAASILVFRETGSAASVGLMLMATAAPSVVVGLIAGVFVDRYDRKKIMIVGNLIQAALVASIPLLVPQGIAWLYIIVALSSAVSQFFDPAHESVLPETAPDEELAAANSLMAISSFGSTAIGFAASGLIASRLSIDWAFYIDALTFLIAGLSILFVTIKPLEQIEGAGVSAVVKNLRTGLSFLNNTPILRSLFLVMMPVLVAFGLSNALLLPFATRALDASEFEFGIQEALTSVGFVAGSLVMASRSGRLAEGQWLTVGWLGMGLAGVAYSLSTNIPVAIIILTISGFLNAPTSIARRLIIQRNTPREMRGRVNSSFFVARDVLFLIGMSAAGLADVIDVRIMYFSGALIIVLSGGLVQFMPGLRQNAADWRRAMGLLRAAPAAPGLETGRAATPADLDRLVGHFAPLARLGAEERAALLEDAQVVEAPAGTAILRFGEASEEAYFILSGRAVAGLSDEGDGYRALETMREGDFFGEIAALTGTRRTADVVAEEDTTMLQVTTGALRGMMANEALSRHVLAKMTERLTRTSIKDLPRFAGYDQQELRELRLAEAEAGDKDRE